MMKSSHDNLARSSSEMAAWLSGQREALEAAVNGAPLSTALSPLVRTAVEALGEGARAAFYLSSDDGRPCIM
ncbi:MAG TPA: hypothetical protein VFT08_08565 [Pyrinomonadaceae bacterium]|nr:hypothetical protein [Pyrinomonadaceae bacterium]